MKMPTLIWFLAALLTTIGLGCAAKGFRVKPLRGPPSIAAGHINYGLNCWYVENDSAGGHGYACGHRSRSVTRPDGGGLFQCIQDLRLEIQRTMPGLQEIGDSYTGRVPDGWKIRNLTQAEVNFLVTP